MMMLTQYWLPSVVFVLPCLVLTAALGSQWPSEFTE
jgi:hypothetical protein